MSDVAPGERAMAQRADLPADTGLTIIALHGNGGGSFRFERMLPFVPPDIHFRGVTLPGFGGAPPDLSLRTINDYALRLQSMIADASRPLVLLGHGIGGSIALELMQHNPESVDALVLHAPVGARLDSRFFPRLMAIPGARAFGRYLFSSRLLRPLFRRLLFSNPVPDEYTDRFFEEYRRCSVFAQMFDLITPEWFRSLHAVERPTALLWGERERVLNVSQIEDYLVVLPGAVMRIMSGWDHFPMIEQPREYAVEVVRLARDLIAVGDSERKNG